MNKADLIRETAKRTGLSRREALRGVEATLETIKRAVGSDNTIFIRGLGRLQLTPKRNGFAPALSGGPPRPIPAGKAVRLKVTRGTVASLNAEPLKLTN
ncbi:MAG TPA: HU family DNA-binding protein, partial [Blastocatellia bacterium]|nr:HU family DNA-binding protein [Blastocatellia bacterium]